MHAVELSNALKHASTRFGTCEKIYLQIYGEEKEKNRFGFGKRVPKLSWFTTRKNISVPATTLAWMYMDSIETFGNFLRKKTKRNRKDGKEIVQMEKKPYKWNRNSKKAKEVVKKETKSHLLRTESLTESKTKRRHVILISILSFLNLYI